jgi:predicted MFS family arabinose efflux permease
MKISTRTLLVIAVPFLADFAIGAASLGMPLYALRLGANELMLGVIGGGGMGIYMVASLLSHRMGRGAPTLAVLLAALTIYGAAVAATPLCRTAWQVAVVAAISLGVMGFFWPRFEIWIAEGRNARELSRDLGLFGASWCAGIACGAAGGGALFELEPWWAFAGATAACVLTIAIVLLCQGEFPRQCAPSAPASPVGQEPVTPIVPRPDARRYLLIGWSATLVAWMGIGIVRSIFPKLAEDLHFSASIIGMLLGLCSLAQGTTFFLMGRSRFWQYRLAPVLVAEGIAIVAAGMVIFGSTLAPLAIAMILLGGTSAVGYTASLFYSVHGRSGATTLSGIHEAVLAAGSTAGPLVGGALASTLAYPRAPYWMMGIVMAVTMAVQIGISRHRGRSA